MWEPILPPISETEWRANLVTVARALAERGETRDGQLVLAYFNPGSTLGAAANGNLRISSVAVNTMLAGMADHSPQCTACGFRYGKPDASMTGMGFSRASWPSTAERIVNPMASVVIGMVGACCAHYMCEFVEHKLKLDDVVGAISVHGANGLWGVISVGLFADGKSDSGST